MVPVIVPKLELTAPAGTTNALEMTTQFGTWQDIALLVFTNSTISVVDQIPRGGSAFYRLRRVSGSSGGVNPPFPAPRTNLVWMPPGQFVMGSPNTDPDALGEEQPQTVVTLTKGFFVGKYEVTGGEYLAVLGTNPSQNPDTNAPVETVSWQQATNFCRLLNLQEAAASRLPAGYAYRLPTEAEWEYAARAGSTNRFSWGNDYAYASLGSYAWYTINSGGSTHPVGETLPNAWGLYDTAGNVSEWCQDWSAAYPGGTVTDPQGPAAGTTKVFRGGSYSDDAIPCRPAGRRSISPTQALDSFGFRIVLAATAP